MARVAGAASEEEARAYLQARLTVLWKIMFWAIAAIVASQWLFYEVIYADHPRVRPLHQGVVYVIAAGGLAMMAVVWRGLLVRRTLSVGQLFGLDLLYGAAGGLSHGAVAVLAADFPPAHYVCLIYGVFVVFTRAIVVPSSGRWTALTSIATLAPLVAAAFVLALSADVIAPGPMFFFIATMLACVTVLLATIGSRTIYGLRRQVDAAMQLGQYTLEAKIGEGGMGAVYRARHTLLRRETAVKLLLPDRVGPDNIARFEREVRHMSQLTHPNTVAVFDYGRSPDGVFYYAMEYLGGGLDLERLVRTHGAQPAGRVAAILGQVCGALAEAHGNNIIHRDIKPANIILCERGGMPDVAKVVDFGLVKEITRDSGTTAQVILGTPAYVAPEAVTDPGSIGPAADLYSLGAVGYYLITGRRVFEGKTAVDVCIQHVTAAPRRPSELAPGYVPPDLEAIILRCLAKDPRDRFASAHEMAAALRSLSRTHDWDEGDAHRWWLDFRTNVSTSKIDVCARTITVDLSQRAAIELS